MNAVMNLIEWALLPKKKYVSQDKRSPTDEWASDSYFDLNGHLSPNSAASFVFLVPIRFYLSRGRKGIIRNYRNCEEKHDFLA